MWRLHYAGWTCICVCVWMDSIQLRYAYENVLSFDNEKDSKNQRNNWLMGPRWTDKRIMKCAECMWFVNSAGCVGKKMEQNCPVITNTRAINWFEAFNAEMQVHCDLKLYIYLNKTNARNKPCYILARAWTVIASGADSGALSTGYMWS